MAATADPISFASASSFSSSAPPASKCSSDPSPFPSPVTRPVRGRTKSLQRIPGVTAMDTAEPYDFGSSRTIRKTASHDNVQRLSATEVRVLASSSRSLPVALALSPRMPSDQERKSDILPGQPSIHSHDTVHPNGMVAGSLGINGGTWRDVRDPVRRPTPSLRTVSTPPTMRFSLGPETSVAVNPNGTPLPSPGPKSKSLPFSPQPSMGPPPSVIRSPSPVPPLIPLPPMSIPTHLQLELAGQTPSPLYIHNSHANDIPYESHAIKLERLKNVLLIPPFLERTLNFGALACLDAWLFTFTILPIRFAMALMVLVRWWVYVVVKEAHWLVGFVWYGTGRLWTRGRTHRGRIVSDISDSGRSRSCSRASRASEASVDVASSSGVRHHPRSRVDSRVRSGDGPKDPIARVRASDPGPKSGSFRHRRPKSMPSKLSPYHKADLLQGAIIICSSLALMRLDASRMYHLIRAQSAIKLYVVYNILEVGDRLLSTIGQDILECLFSTETLSRNASGRSKVLLPMGMFVLALLYSCLHSISLYIQVITLNVAVNSYSNALLTLLLSNQFVEIKSTVFKRFEKNNLFQLTCADIVERFHLWIMLLIIGMRNIVEVGGLSIPSINQNGPSDSSPSTTTPLHPPSILPHSFTVLPSWLMSGEVLSPFLIVVGSEMLVDTIKHAYVTKFNNIKPKFYSRILDILCKDYYTNAFTTPTLTRRLGLAVIPLSCLFIRASIQTYHMLLSAHIPMPFPASTQTELSKESATPTSPAMSAALNRFDMLIRDSLGRATYGYPTGSPLNSRPWYSWTSDDVIAALTMVVVFFIIFLVLLVLKLLLGMVLLKYSRSRYAKMKSKEALVAAGKAEWDVYIGSGQRTGGFGQVEVGDDRSRWLNADPNEGLKRSKSKGTNVEAKQDGDYPGVFRFDMVEKRIW